LSIDSVISRTDLMFISGTKASRDRPVGKRAMIFLSGNYQDTFTIIAQSGIFAPSCKLRFGAQAR